MSAWNNEEIFEFIHLYQKEPCIWNPNDEFYKHRNKINEAWSRIADAMDIPVPELKKKKESLMTAFRTNYKKKNSSIKLGSEEGDVFKPTWIFYDALENFLKDVYECKSILNGDEEAVITQLDYEMSTDDELATKMCISGQKRHYTNTSELEESSTQLKSALSALNTVLNTMQKKYEKEDECDLYGKLVAKKLKRFSGIDRQELMYEIDSLLLQKIQSMENIVTSTPKRFPF